MFVMLNEHDLSKSVGHREDLTHFLWPRAINDPQLLFPCIPHCMPRIILVGYRKFMGAFYVIFIIVAATPTRGLYFMMGTRLLLPGESVNITDIGEQPPYDRSDNGSTLVCVTDNVNLKYCWDGESEGILIGDWIHNNQPVLSLNNAAGLTDVFVRIVYTCQLHLAAKGHPTGPVGNYTCSVPHTNGTNATATVSLINVLAGEHIITTFMAYHFILD